MEEKLGFSLFQKQITNQTVEVVYTPDSSVTSYTYDILVDGETVKTETVSSMEATTFTFENTGVYQIRILNTFQNGRKTSVTSGLYRIDKQAPILKVGEKERTVKENFNVLQGVIATDVQDGDLTEKITTNYDSLDFSSSHVQTLVYTVEDRAGNVATESVTLHIINTNANELHIFQLALFIFVSLVTFLLMKYLRSVRLAKRIGKYGVKSVTRTYSSLFDDLHRQYQILLSYIKKYIQKSVFLTKYSKRYEKYIGVIHNGFTSGMDFVANKFVVSLLVLGLAVISKTLQYQVLSLYEIWLPLFIGFFLPDILNWYSYKNYRKELENDLLQAIIIMNNAFKSGRSITQAVELVANELDGPIGKEYKKMIVELSFGLSIEEVFKRFSDRVKLEEVAYLTASLTVLNHTGGNIIQVFSSIETSLFSKKKLRLELESLTGTSRILMYVLFCIPIFFCFFVSIINPNYFSPFFTSEIGWILFFIIVILYISYILIVRKIMKVRM